MEELSPLQKFLAETTVENIAPQLSDNFITLRSNKSIYEALQTLSKNKVSSAPVLDENGVAIGMCSLMDIVVFVLQCFNLGLTNNNSDEEKQSKDIDPDEESPFELLARGSDVSKRPLSDLMWNQTSIDSYVVLTYGTTLKDALPEFADGVHRCAVMTPDNMKLLSILSQSTIVKYLASKPELLEEFGETPISDLAIGTSPVITAPMTDRTIDVFELLAKYAVSGVAIVDNSGSLLGNISAKDLAVCEQNNLYESMRKDARSFIQKIKSGSINITSPAIAVSEDSSLNTVLMKLAGNGIHRIYVCDSEQKPVRVISLRDILDFVYDITNTESNNTEEFTISGQA